MIRLKCMSSDGLTSITRLRNELISECGKHTLLDDKDKKLDLSDDLMTIISKYVKDPLNIQFIVTQSSGKVVLVPISPQAVELFRLLEL